MKNTRLDIKIKVLKRLSHFNPIKKAATKDALRNAIIIASATLTNSPRSIRDAPTVIKVNIISAINVLT